MSLDEEETSKYLVQAMDLNRVCQILRHPSHNMKIKVTKLITNLYKFTTAISGDALFLLKRTVPIVIKMLESEITENVTEAASILEKLLAENPEF